MNKKVVVRLSDEERVVCQEIIKPLKGSAQKCRRAQILLKADAENVWLWKALHWLWTGRNARSPHTVQA